MGRIISSLLLGATLSGSVTLTASAGDSPVLTTDARLYASLQRVYAGSATWRSTLEAVRQTGRRLFVVPPADPLARLADQRSDRHRFDPASLAEVVPVVREDSRVGSVLVIVNVPLVQRLHDARTSVLRDFESDLDRIVIHEVYGHAIPYLLTGTLAARCADPAPNERPAEACAIRRENAVRAELDLGRRTDAGLSSLLLSRASGF